MLPYKDRLIGSSSSAISSPSGPPLLIGAKNWDSRILAAPIRDKYPLKIYRTPRGLVRAAQDCPSALVLLNEGNGSPFGLDTAGLLLNQNPYQKVLIRTRRNIPQQWKQIFKALGQRPLIVKTDRSIREPDLSRRQAGKPETLLSPQTLKEFSQLASTLSHTPPAESLRELIVLLEATIPRHLRLVAVTADDSIRLVRDLSSELNYYRQTAARILELLRSPARRHPELPGEIFAREILYIPVFDKGHAVAVLGCHRSGGWLPAQRRLTADLLRVWATAQLHACAVYRERGTDPLTGAGDRTRLMNDLRKMVQIARQKGHCLGIAFIDLQQLKKINQRHGYRAGDLYLKQIAAGLGRQLPPDGRLYRYGGDEFIALVLDQSGKEARHRLEQAIVRATAVSRGSSLRRPAHYRVYCLTQPDMSSVRKLLRTGIERTFCSRKP